MSDRSADVLILGGGVVGLACARYLLRAGRSVSVIERATVGGATSHGNCGTITPSHCAPLAVPGQVRQALGWLLRADAPFRVAPRLDIDLLRWFWRFSRQCNWREFERVTRIKWPLLQLARRALEDLIRDDGLDCQFETLGTLNVYRDARAFEALARGCTKAG